MTAGSPDWKPKELAWILKASSDPVFFAEHPFFLGLKLYPKQAEILRQFYSGNYTDLILVAGMRSGKTFLGSVIAAYEAFQILSMDNPQAYWGLADTSPIFILNVARSEQQAKDTVFAQIEPKIRGSPFFLRFKPRFRTSSIYFPTHYLTILSGTSSAASMVGRTAKAVIFDELARFEETEKRGARMVWSSLSHSTLTFKQDGHRIVISSPVHPGDIVMELYRMAQTHPNMLGLKIPTWEMNPNISFEDLRPELEKDPASFWRDYGCEPSKSTSTFFRDPARIRRVMTGPNLLELLDSPQLPALVTAKEYILAIDPALRNDAFGIAIGHLDPSGIIIIDGAYRFVPEAGEISPFEVKAYIRKVASLFPVSTILFDLWHFPELLEELRILGVHLEFHRVSAEDYFILREKIYRGEIQLPKYEVLYDELSRLVQKSATKVDHPSSGSKDVADCVANITQWLQNMKRSHLPHLVEVF